MLGRAELAPDAAELATDPAALLAREMTLLALDAGPPAVVEARVTGATSEVELKEDERSVLDSGAMVSTETEMALVGRVSTLMPWMG